MRGIQLSTCLLGICVLTSVGTGKEFKRKDCTDQSFAYQRLKVNLEDSQKRTISLGAGALGGFRRYLPPVAQNEYFRASVSVELSSEGKCDESPTNSNLFACIDPRAKFTLSSGYKLGSEEDHSMVIEEVLVRLRSVKVEDHFINEDNVPVISYFISLIAYPPLPQVPIVFQLTKMTCNNPL